MTVAGEDSRAAEDLAVAEVEVEVALEALVVEVSGEVAQVAAGS
jgi:hypothetical protein